MGRSHLGFAARLFARFGPKGSETPAPTHRTEAITLDALARLAQTLIAGDNFEAMLQAAFDIVAEHLGANPFASYVLEHEAGGGVLVLTASRGLDPAQLALVRRQGLDTSLAGLVFQRAEPVVIARIDRDPGAYEEVVRTLGLQAFAGFPLRMDGHGVVGALCVGLREAERFTPDELTLMQAVTAQVSAAMERLHLERAARDSEARLRLALEVSGMGAWSWNVAQDALEADRELLRLHGLDPAGPAVASSARILAQVHPDDRDTLIDAVEHCAASHDTLRCDYRVTLPGDGIRWLSAHGRALRGDSGRVTTLVGLTQDITANVARREGLEREAAGFERLAEHRAEALAASEDRLAQASKMEALGRLAGGIAHDFNNVLQAVESSASLALRCMDTDPNSTRRFLRIATDACARGAAVTERLLAFGRRTPLHASAVDLDALLESVAGMLRVTLGPQILLEVDCPGDLPPVFADRSRLEAVLINLANNARDAMPEGGRLTLGADLSSDGGWTARPALRLSVTDEGTGMPPEILARVSEPFFTTKPMGKGTGLGLAMARGFVEQSNGTFAIDSAPGLGTTVTMLLPQAESRALVMGLAEPTTSWPVAAPPAAILLVEDRPEIRAVLAAELTEDGHNVTAVADADAALALVNSGFEPDAIVADLLLPGRNDGLAVLTKARRRLPGLPGLLVTGHVSSVPEGRIANVRASGPFAVLHKPVTGDKLRDELSMLLAEARRGPPP